MNLEKDTVKCFLIKGCTDDSNDDAIGEIITLKHPKNNCPTKYLLRNDILFEIMLFDNKKSLFVDNYVKSNGYIYFSASFDPIFIVLPIFKEKALNTFVNLKEILQDEFYPDLSKLINCSGLQYLKVTLPSKENAFMYDEDMVMGWLDKKFSQIVEVLAEKRPNISSELILKEASGILSQYLSNDIYRSFIEHRGLETSNNKKRPSLTPVKQSVKKHKSK